jgi:hypothetical protein
MEYIRQQTRWLRLAMSLVLAAAMIVVVSSPASAQTSDEGVSLFMELMSENGHIFASESEAQAALTESGIPIAVAIDLLKDRGASADLFLPLVIEVVNEGGAPAGAVSAFSTECGSQSTKINLKGGASGWTVLWHRLSTSHCYDGTNIIGTPTASVSSGRTAYGIGLGYRWTSTPTVTSQGWITYPTKYRVSEQGTYKICPGGGPWCYGGSDPWIRHDKYGTGASIASYGL